MGLQQIYDEVVYESLIYFNVLPFQPVNNLLGAIPSVANCVRWICNDAITVTNFTDGADGQSIKILGNGSKTISNNTLIKTNTAANKVLASNKVYTFTYFKTPNLWVENA